MMIRPSKFFNQTIKFLKILLKDGMKKSTKIHDSSYWIVPCQKFFYLKEFIN